MTDGAPGRGAVPLVSIVVGAAGGEGSAAPCVEALAGQADADVEVIVETGDRLVPELWADGIARSTGAVVALLASTSVPDEGWVARTRQAHEGGRAAIGGPIEAGPGLTLVDWAVYFCRYAPYMAPVAEDAGLEVPGDNASYDGEVLRRYHDLYRDGFWEPFVHAAMRADGHRFGFCPERVVRVLPGARSSEFARQRFVHGRAHGRARSRGVSRVRVLLGAATAPLVPLVMAGRTVRTVLGKGRNRARLAVALPLVLWFFCCWAAGELAGRLDAVRRPPA